MSLARQYIWVLVIVGMIFSSLVICIIFLLINRCISRRGKHRILQLHRPSDSKAGSNTYQEKAPNDGTPPLPPRTQFLTAEVLDDVHDYEECPEPLPGSMKADQETELRLPAAFYSHPAQKMKPGVVEALSYENLAEEHDYEESTDQPDYIKVEDETEAFPAPPTYMKPDPKTKPGVIEAFSYENLAEEPDYEQSLDDQPDYMKVEDEEALLTNPVDPADDNASSEDYDDIDGGDGHETQDDEDYDDVA